MSKRERILALIVMGLVGLFVLDQFALRPMMAHYQQLNERADELEGAIRSARVLLDHRTVIEQRWRAMASAGLISEASAQRFEVQRRLTHWAERARFNLTNVSAGQPRESEHFDELRFVASGSGSLRELATFLAEVEGGDYPLRIIESEMTSRNDRGDELTLRVTFSTVGRADDEQVVAQPEATARWEGDGR